MKPGPFANSMDSLDRIDRRMSDTELKLERAGLLSPEEPPIVQGKPQPHESNGKLKPVGDSDNGKD